MTPGFDWGLQHQGLWALMFFGGLGVAAAMAVAFIERGNK